MVTLEKIESIAGRAAHLPPCSDANYQRLAEDLRTTLREWRNELQDNSRYLDLLQHASRKTGDKGLFEDSMHTAEYKRRAVELLSNDAQIAEVGVRRNGRAR